MPSFNKIVLIGRLTHDPEKRYTTSGLAVTSFSIAVDRRSKNQQGERQTDFFRCTAWRQSAEFVADYITKGRLVAVEGRIEINEFVGQDGQKRKSADVVCDHVEILESNRDQQTEGGGGYSAGSTPSTARAPQDNAPQADGGNGYFPDDDMAATPQPRAPQRPQGGAVNPNAGGNRPAPTPAPTRAPQGNRPAPAAQPAYPENDFDDSDPFADE